MAKRRYAENIGRTDGQTQRYFTTLAGRLPDAAYVAYCSRAAIPQDSSENR